MFVEVAKELKKGIKSLHHHKFESIKFNTEEDRKIYFDKVVHLNKRLIPDGLNQYIAVRNTGSGWISFKKETSLEAFKSALEVHPESKKLGIAGVYFDPDYIIKKDPPRMVFLKNFPITWKQEDIYDFVKAFGEIDTEKDDNNKPLVKDGKTVRKIYVEMSAQPPFD